MRLKSNEWKSNRSAALKRDDFKCRNCGNHANDVHHIIPFRISKSNDIKGLVTLCRTCHKTADNYYIRYGLTQKMKRWQNENANERNIHRIQKAGRPA